MKNEIENSERDSDTGNAVDVHGTILAYVDGILRHRAHNFRSLFEDRDTLRQISRLLIVVVALSAFHGFTMGMSSGVLQGLSAALKVPVLFLVTLGVCFPMLYVVNVIMGSNLGFLQTLALILIAMALATILLAACSPIVLFFAITGSSYTFIKLLNVAIFTFSGIWGMLGLLRGLRDMCRRSELFPQRAIAILQIWILIYGFVGTQMAWSLRPFIGSPELGFQVFREQESNFYQDVWGSIGQFRQELRSPE